MPLIEMTTQRKSIFKRGAEQGAIMGAYFTVLYLCVIFCLKVPMLSMIAMTLIPGVPVLTYLMLRRSYVQDMGLTRFSELWTQGIMIFACGSLIMAAVSLLYTKIIDPGFIVNYINDTIGLLRESDQSAMADTLELMISSRKLPSPADFAMEFIWLGIFSGSMLSMLMALLVTARKVKSRPPGFGA